MQMKNKVLIAVRIIHSDFLSNHNEIAIINPSADTPLNFYRLIYIYFRKKYKDKNMNDCDMITRRETNCFTHRFATLHKQF